MIFVYLDEFGHCGPYFSRHHPRHNTSPVFGLAGWLVPEESVRLFGSYFLARKTELLGQEIERSGKAPFEWEKKGSSLFTARSIQRFPEIRRAAFRLMNYALRHNCRPFYCGREKIRAREERLNPTGLYKTILSDAIRQLDAHCRSLNQRFVIVIDQHSARKELLETAAKTMFGIPAATQMASPPFEVESYLNQNIQAADWMAAIVGRVWNYKLDQDFADYAQYADIFWRQISGRTVASGVRLRR